MFSESATGLSPVYVITPLASGVPSQVPPLVDAIYPQPSSCRETSYEEVPAHGLPPPTTSIPLQLTSFGSAAVILSPLMAPPPLFNSQTDDGGILELPYGLQFARPPPTVDTQLAFRCERNGSLPVHRETLHYFFNLGMAAYRNTMVVFAPALPTTVVPNSAPIHSADAPRFPLCDFSVPPPPIQRQVVDQEANAGVPLAQRPPRYAQPAARRENVGDFGQREPRR